MLKKRILLAIFILMSLLPLAGMAVVGPSGAAANEILTEPPKLVTKDGFNEHILNDVCDYLADHFAWRQELVTADAAVEAALLRESACEDVVLGSDGWLYYAETLHDYQGTSLMSERETYAAAHNLDLIQEYCEDRGMAFLFTVAPNKNTLYPEHMPYSGSNADGNLSHLADALAAQGVACLDLRAVFKAQDAVLYHKLDSHWNNLGAALAHDAIMDALGKDYETAYVPEGFSSAQDHRGDLYDMLYPKGTEFDTQYYPAEWRFDYARPIRSAEDQTILTESDAGGSLMMFRDSFGNALHPFLAQSFGSATFSRANPYDLSLCGDADTLLIEIVERNLPWLCERAPILPAPEREMELPAPSAVDFTAASEGEKITGTLSETPDADSPIWLCAEGKIYEACLVGEAGFSACLPEAAENIQVIFRRNGTLICSESQKIIQKEKENK